MLDEELEELLGSLAQLFFSRIDGVRNHDCSHPTKRPVAILKPMC